MAAKRGIAPGTSPSNVLWQHGHIPRGTVQCTFVNLGCGTSRRTRVLGETGTSAAPQSGHVAGASATLASSASSAATSLRPCPSCPGFAPPCRARLSSGLSFLKFCFDDGVFSA